MKDDEPLFGWKMILFLVLFWTGVALWVALVWIPEYIRWAVNG